jgi:hypothetical protein
VSRIDISLVQFKVLICVSGSHLVESAVIIFSQTAALAPVGPEPAYRYAAGDALLAMFTMRPVRVAAAASVSEFDELTIQLNIHLHAWIRHKIGRHVVGQITAFMFGSEIQIEVL